MSAARVLAVVLSDRDVDAAAESVASCRQVGIQAWVVERDAPAVAEHGPLGAPVLAADWSASGDGVVQAASGLADWLLVLAAGESVRMCEAEDLPTVVGRLDRGPVRVTVGSSAEVRLHPPTDELTDRLGGQLGPLATGFAIVPAAAPVAIGCRLHLGCGPNRLDGWINVDVEPRYRPDVVHDLSTGLPADDGTVDLIYSEHFWEHLHIDDGIQLMRHCWRALRPGGVLRIAMPDLEECVRRYLGDWRGEAWVQDRAYDWVDTPARMLNASFREWEHRYLYDAHDVTVRLRSVGFEDVRRCQWGCSDVAALRGLETRPESLLVVEAVR